MQCLSNVNRISTSTYNHFLSLSLSLARILDTFDKLIAFIARFMRLPRNTLAFRIDFAVNKYTFMDCSLVAVLAATVVVFVTVLLEHHYAIMSSEWQFMTFRPHTNVNSICFINHLPHFVSHSVGNMLYVQQAQYRQNEYLIRLFVHTEAVFSIKL